MAIPEEVVVAASRALATSSPDTLRVVPAKATRIMTMTANSANSRREIVLDRARWSTSDSSTRAERPRSTVFDLSCETIAIPPTCRSTGRLRKDAHPNLGQSGKSGYFDFRLSVDVLS